MILLSRDNLDVICTMSTAQTNHSFKWMIGIRHFAQFLSFFFFLSCKSINQCDTVSKKQKGSLHRMYGITRRRNNIHRHFGFAL